MQIIEIKPNGFCKGVARSLALAKQTRLKYPSTPITICGALVHNRYISEALKFYNIRTLTDNHRTKSEMLDDIDTGIVIFSAHGIATSVIEKAEDKGLTIVDATCPDVKETHLIIERFLENKYQIIYIGKKGHPETQAVVDTYPIFFIEKLENLDNLDIDYTKPIMVTNQTTLSILQMKEFYDAILIKAPHAQIENEICMATTLRQEAILNHIPVDVLIVVGDPHSNNTAMLAKIGKAKQINRIYRIESVEDLKVEWFNNDDRVAITAGASTPRSLTKQVIEFMKTLDVNHPVPIPKVVLQDIL